MHLERAYCVWSILWLYNAASEDSDQSELIPRLVRDPPGHSPSLNRVFTLQAVGNVGP